MATTKGKAATSEIAAADVKAANPDAVFGRFMLTLGQVMRGVQLLKFDPEF